VAVEMLQLLEEIQVDKLGEFRESPLWITLSQALKIKEGAETYSAQHLRVEPKMMI